jgi:5-methylcytosine-specific restriction endonuclease McrA
VGRTSKVKRQRILKRDGYRCQHCGAEEGPGVKGSLQIDHIIPTSRGGTHHESNLQVLCFVCNVRKLDHLPQEAPENVVMRWAERVFGHVACRDGLRIKHIRRLLRELEIAKEFQGPTNHRDG